ncbi:MAG: Gfo/Idh/MocA family oxidoreductase [Coxiellaceae bacterium]|nr:Gfo/Idh/MocA family oxidoreductase [Coxiellaceae bacterium]
MRALIIGYGSIGSRHARILNDLGCNVSLVSSKINEQYHTYKTLEAAFKENSYDKIIVSNSTNLHHETLKEINNANFNGTILIEKPLFSKSENLQNQDNVYIAYNLRFHELIQKLKIVLQDDELISFSVQVGAYLPDWRKNIDYKNCYSAKKESGGGVLRDLSHELDYILWLCGNCIEVTAMGGHYSNLEINSDDIYSILMQCERCPIINIQLDYLNKTPSRQIIIHTKNHKTFFLDLIKGEFYMNGELILKVQDAIAKTYIRQHELLLRKEVSDFCDYKQGLSIVKLIEVIEQSSFDRKWITL